MIRVGISPTANRAIGPCNNATVLGFWLSTVSRRRGISNSSSTLSPSFQARATATNFPGSIGVSARFPFMERVVFGPVQAGILKYSVNVSGRASANASSVVFARGYSVV